jgi:periplasmic protein CpxP/Spy
MKTWIKRTAVGLAAALGLAALAGGAAGCSHRMHGGPGFSAMSEQDAAAFKARMIERAGQHLDLDAAQKDKLSVLADRLREQRNALVGNSDPRAEVRAFVAGNTFDRAGAQAFVEAKTNSIRAGAPVLIAAAGDFFDSLRPEQQQKLRDVMQQRRGRHHGG